MDARAAHRHEIACSHCGFVLGAVEAAKGDPAATGYSLARVHQFRDGQVFARCSRCKLETQIPLEVRVVFGTSAAKTTIPSS